ncbi:MAG: acyl-CoA dehydrogenase family protein [Aeromicrobium sp.]|uniref:acyl-CoA dehydrogenase family protein n=1 Tax=Aeromicrobium sp. TaxID=1871063 RepID=UPI00261AC02C|nr:acyl-CoA dehydrogenase family protein [Aeromicrobium sp.]MDF1703544.1 acyl-CoA dehydrogenase family protein [Aeromicrobium sp.]
MRLQATELTRAERDLQYEVRSWLDERLPEGSSPLGLGMAGAIDPEFSRDLGAQGWLGMSLPVEHGGHGRTAVDRLVVVEALLARGAPVGYHWIGDRQSGPSIAANGTELQKKELLPGIASGELSFSIGMSEPDSGSDLASVRTRAERVDGGWVVNGAKIWTTGAFEATHILSLFRTSEDRHSGLTQFIVDRHAPGLTVSPIEFIDGTKDFCELSFVDMFISDDWRLGEVGSGWGQNTGELALERGGVDRWMSAMPLVERWAVREAAASGTRATAELGSIVARCWAFRGMSLAVARMVDDGQSPVTEAALIKEMATRFEQECLEVMVRHLGRPLRADADDPYEALLAKAVQVAPSWTIRGGTNEILRSVISKGLRTR